MNEAPWRSTQARRHLSTDRQALFKLLPAQGTMNATHGQEVVFGPLSFTPPVIFALEQGEIAESSRMGPGGPHCCDQEQLCTW